MLKEYRLGAFPSRGCGLFLAPDRSFPFLAKPRCPDVGPASGASCKNDGIRLTGSPKTTGSLRQKREEKRFSRADKDKNGRIEREEILGSRRKAFAKLDKNGNGALSFEEWAVKSIDKFDGADKDRSGWLTAAEYASTAPPPLKKTRCSC